MSNDPRNDDVVTAGDGVSQRAGRLRVLRQCVAALPALLLAGVLGAQLPTGDAGHDARRSGLEPPPPPVPAYVRHLAPFGVRALRGDFAPTDSGVSMVSVTPAEWLERDPGSIGLRGVIAAWSGGGKALTGTRLFLSGGGHNDSANNGLYVYDFAGEERPRGWSLASISAVADVRVASTYGDGRPRATHTYDGMVLVGSNSSLYRFGGAPWSPPGGFASESFRYGLDDGAWTELDPFPETLRVVSTIHDPVSGKILVGSGGQFHGRFYRTDNNTWGERTNGRLPWPREATGAYDPRRKRGLLVGKGQSRIVAIDWQQESAALATVEATGDTEILEARGASAFYDPDRDAYWLFGGTDAGDGWWTGLYEMDAESFEITRHALTGEPLEVMRGLRGNYGRFVFLRGWRAIGVVTDPRGPAYIIRLPGTGQGVDGSADAVTYMHTHVEA